MWESGGNWSAHCARRESETGTAWTKNRHQSLSSCFLLGSTGCFYLFMALSVAHPHVPFLFFACSCTVDESTSRFLPSKLEFLCKGTFFFFFSFCRNSQLCIMIQMRRRNTPSFINAWEHRRVQWVDWIFAFVYFGENKPCFIWILKILHTAFNLQLLSLKGRSDLMFSLLRSHPNANCHLW